MHEIDAHNTRKSFFPFHEAYFSASAPGCSLIAYVVGCRAIRRWRMSITFSRTEPFTS
jgi:hypothetical protein